MASKCIGCLSLYEQIDKDEDFEAISDEEEHELLDRYLKKSCSGAKEKAREEEEEEEEEIVSDRACYHGSITFDEYMFNAAGVPLSPRLLKNALHIPNVLNIDYRCDPNSFKRILGYTDNIVEPLTNIIVFKFIPEDLEDEDKYNTLFETLVDKRRIARLSLKCDIFKSLFIVPLPKENEPPAFLPITSRINLENAPREDNFLLGILVKKAPKEDGEVTEESNTTSSENSHISVITLSPTTPHSPTLSSPKNISCKKTCTPTDFAIAINPSMSPPASPLPSFDTHSPISREFNLERNPSPPPNSFVPTNRYSSFLSTDPENVPFLTDDVFSLTLSNKKAQNDTSAKKRTSSTSHDATLSDINSEEEDDYAIMPMDLEDKDTTDKNNEDDNETIEASSRKRYSDTKNRSESSHGDQQPPKRFARSLSETSSVAESHSMLWKLPPKITFSPPESQNRKLASPSSTLTNKAEIKRSEFKASTSSSSVDAQDNPLVIDIDLQSVSSENSVSFNHSKSPGMLCTDTGSFQFIYTVIRYSGTSQPLDYLPNEARVKGRSHLIPTESYLKAAISSGNEKLILFRIKPRNCDESLSIFSTYVKYLLEKKRYGKVESCKSSDVSFYVIPHKKQHQRLKALDIIKIKPADQDPYELYGCFIRPTVKPPQTPPEKFSTSSEPSKSSTRKESSNKKAESSEIHSNHHDDFGPELFPDISLDLISRTVSSGVDDPVNLSVGLLNLIKLDRPGPEEKKVAAEECNRKLQYLLKEEEKEYLKRKQAYIYAIDLMNTLIQNARDR